MNLGLCSIVAVFDYVRFFKCSISECSIVFDWQNFGLSSIKFDYEPNRSQSNDCSSIGFDYQPFDWLRRVNTKDDTRWSWKRRFKKREREKQQKHDLAQVKPIRTTVCHLALSSFLITSDCPY